MFAVVDVRYHRHDSTDFASFRHRGTGIYRYVCIPCEVARTAKPVHHLGAQDVSGIDVAEYIGFQSCVYRNQSKTAHYLGIVRNLLRTEYDVAFEHIYLVGYLLHYVGRDGKRAAADELHFTFLDKPDNGVLYHLGIHIERWNVVVRAERTEHRIGDIAHARLYGQERLRNATRFQLVFEEKRHVAADSRGYFVDVGKGFYSVGYVCFNHTDDFRRVDLDYRIACSIAHVADRDRFSRRRVERLIYVVNTFERSGHCLIELHNDVFCHLADSGSNTDTCGKHHAAVVREATGFHNGVFRSWEKTVTNLLSQMRQVHIEIRYLTLVDSLTHIAIRLIRRAEYHRFTLRQRPVQHSSCRSTCIDTNLKLFALSV